MGRKFKDIKHEINNEFDNLLNDHHYGHLDSHISFAAVRPPYAYTSLCPDPHWREPATPERLIAKQRETR